MKHVIYVSCNPTKSLIKDSLLLCGPPSQKFSGEAFRPVRVVPVDMFPHTEHCEAVCVFSRGSEVADTAAVETAVQEGGGGGKAEAAEEGGGESEAAAAAPMEAGGGGED